MLTDSTFPDTLVQALSHAVSSGESSFDSAPGLLRQILEGQLWRSRVIKLTHERAEFDQFSDFISSPPLEGLGTNEQVLRALVAHDPDVSKLLDQTIKGLRPALAEYGTNQYTRGGNIITSSPKRRGSDPDYILDRCKRDYPDLAYRMMYEGLSANRAAIEAGINPPKISVNLKDMRSAAGTLASRLDADQIDELISELQKQRG